MKLQNVRLLTLNNPSTELESGLQFDPENGLIFLPRAADLAKLSAMEIKCGLPEGSALTPQQRVDRLAAYVSKLKPLSANGKPKRPVRWTDSKGKSQVDLAAIFDQEQVPVEPISAE